MIWLLDALEKRHRFGFDLVLFFISGFGINFIEPSTFDSIEKNPTSLHVKALFSKTVPINTFCGLFWFWRAFALVLESDRLQFGFGYNLD